MERSVPSHRHVQRSERNDANKPLTRARARILSSQNSQANENHSLATNAKYCTLPTHAQAPSGSRLTIKRLKD